jgi:hypothetical protein
VGIGKKEYLYDELGEGTIELMKNIKRTIDPLGLFNPGKVNKYAFTAGTESDEQSQLYPDKPETEPRPVESITAKSK